MPCWRMCPWTVCFFSFPECKCRDCLAKASGNHLLCLDPGQRCEWVLSPCLAPLPFSAAAPSQVVMLEPPSHRIPEGKGSLRNLIYATDGGCCCLGTKSCPTLCDPMDPLSMGFPRQEYWSRLPFPLPGESSQTGIKPMSPALAGRFFTTEHQGRSMPLVLVSKFSFFFFN